MSIEADRQAIDTLPVDLTMLASLRETARLAATHYSTQIEGNRLTQAQVREVLDGAQFPGRERDEHEVRHYYQALQHIEHLAAVPGPVTELDVRTTHGLLLTGQSAPTPYRDGQNVIRDGRTGAIVYMPPESADVPTLMANLVSWIQTTLTSRALPAPLTAAIAHYQFATIHPYFDGNGRTARLLTTLILHKSGYGLKGIYSLDEYYARNLTGYYAALTLGPSHNYYLGRAEADITPFLTYFCQGMASAFAAVKAQATQAAARGAQDTSTALRQLDPRQRRLLQLFHKIPIATTAQIAKHLSLSPRTVAPLCRQWTAGGFLTLHNPSRKSRSYCITSNYQALLD
jgi:Fic family protein